MKRCFVISPIGPENTVTRQHANTVLHDIIQPALGALHIEALRADQLDIPGRITDQMFAEIYKADMCIALLTGHNPNVYYELALAQHIGKPLIVLCAETEELPFDIQDLRCIFYPADALDYAPVIERIVQHVKAIEAGNWTAEDIFSAYRRYSASYVPPETLKAIQELRDFCSRAQGYWLSSGVEPDTESVGIVEFLKDDLMNTLALTGRAYNRNGQLITTWQSVASCINLKQKRLYYFWEGDHSNKPGDRFEGFGDITFFDTSEALFQNGKGTFFDKNLSDVKSATVKRTDFYRCTEAQVTGIRRENNRQWMSGLVQEAMARM